MTHSAGYLPEWAISPIYHDIAQDFLAVIDAHDPDRNSVKVAWLIRQNIGGNGTGLSLFDDWANRDGNSPRLLETIWKTTASMTGEDAESWQVPLPIPNTLKPVDSFRFDLLPESLRPWVQDIAERMQCPPDFPAVGAMVALSSVIGRKACIRPKRLDDWTVIPNLWGVIIGRPSAMKSPALSEVLKPLEALEAAANTRYVEEVREFRTLQQLEEMRGKAASKKAQQAIDKGNDETAKHLLSESVGIEEMTPPPRRRYRVNDSTVEALAEIHIDNPNGLLVYRDELYGLLKGMDREGQEGARAFYLQGYDGNQGYTTDRISRGMARRISAVCLSMLGSIQPGKIQGYIREAVRGGSGDDGLLQRFGLMVWPDDNREWRNIDRKPDFTVRDRAFDTFARLDALEGDLDAVSGDPVPKHYRFDDSAQTLFEEWREGLEMLLRSGELHPAMESHLGKYRKLIPALALITALADGESVVSRASLIRALGWCEYLKSHAERAYEAGLRPVTDSASALLAKIKSGVLRNGFSVRDVYLKGWSRLNNPEDVTAAANLLCDLGHLRANEHKSGSAGGRPTATYDINPLSLAGL